MPVSPPVGPRPSAFPSRFASLVLSSLAALVLLGISAPALGYVRQRLDGTFAPYFWADPRKIMEMANPPAETGVTPAVLREAADAAALSWSSATLGCTGVDLSVARDATDRQTSAFDHRNRIIMTVGNWCTRDPSITFDCNRDSAAVALTTLYVRKRAGTPEDGQIQEADIEINAVGRFQWGVIPDGSLAGMHLENTYDLTAVLTHEMGHFIGLAHTCRVSGDLLLPDDADNLSPLCTEVPSKEQALVEDATMYPYMNATDVKLRTLTADDARAACEIYPPSALPLNEWVGSGGCSVAAESAPRGRVALLFVLILAAASALRLRHARRVQDARIARNSAPRPRNRQFD